MKKEKQNSFEKMAITLFMIVLLAPTFLWCGVKVIARVNPDFIQYFIRDTGENRAMVELPKEWNADTITQDLESYYNDRVPFRSMILYYNKRIDWYLDDMYQNKILPAALTVVLGEEGRDSYLIPREVNGMVIPGRDGWLFFAAEDSVSYYQGTNIMSEAEMGEMLILMQRLQEVCDARGIRLQFMITPNKEQVYYENMPNYMIYNTEKREQVFADYVRANSDINIIYTLEDLLAGKELYQMYLKYDTHWTRAGAFIGTQALYRALGLATTDLAELPVEQVGRAVGDLINLAGFDQSLVAGETEYNVSYHCENVVSYSEGDREGEAPLFTETPGATNDCNLVFLGDSYRISMIPYLERDFSRCLFAHVDHLEDTSIYESLYNADILVIAVVERNDVKLKDTLIQLLDIYGEE